MTFRDAAERLAALDVALADAIEVARRHTCDGMAERRRCTEIVETAIADLEARQLAPGTHLRRDVATAMLEMAAAILVDIKVPASGPLPDATTQA